MSKVKLKSWFLAVLSILALSPSILSAATIRVPNISAPPGSDLSIPIEIDDATGVFSAFLVLSYDPDILTAIDQ